MQHTPHYTTSAGAPNTSATTRDDALARIDAAGAAPLPIRPDTKKPAVKWESVRGRLTRARLVRWFAGKRADCGVGVVTRSAGWFAVDLDSPAAAAAWAAREARHGRADTWRVHSRKGAKIMFRRPAWMDADANGNRVRPLPNVLPDADVCLGYVLVWDGSRSWTGGPENVADCPEWLAEILRPLFVQPERAAPSPTPATPCPTPATPPNAGRVVRAAAAAIRYQHTKLSTVTTGRYKALGAAGLWLAEVLARPGAEGLAGEASEALYDACRANGYLAKRGEADIRSQIDHLLALEVTPAPLPDGTDDAGDDAAPDAPDAGDMSAAAAAALEALAYSVASLPEAARRRASVRRIAHVLLAHVAGDGRPVVKMSMHRLAHEADIGVSTVQRALPALAALGLDVRLGTIAPDGSIDVTVWTWRPGAFGESERRMAPCSASGDGRAPTHNSKTGSQEAVIFAKSLPGAPLARSTRRPVMVTDTGRKVARRQRQPDNTLPLPDGALVGCGPSAWAAVAALQDAPAGFTAAELAEVLAIPRRTAADTLARLVARGLASASPAPSTGGRPAVVYSWAGDAAVIAAEIQVGEKLEGDGLAKLDVRAAVMRDARQLARKTGASMGDALARVKAERADRAKSERTRATGADDVAYVARRTAAAYDAHVAHGGQVARPETEAPPERAAAAAEHAPENAPRDDVAHGANAAPCYACGGVETWRRWDGRDMCQRCHPHYAEAAA